MRRKCVHKIKTRHVKVLSFFTNIKISVSLKDAQQRIKLQKKIKVVDNNKNKEEIDVSIKANPIK